MFGTSTMNKQRCDVFRRYCLYLVICGSWYLCTSQVVWGDVEFGKSGKPDAFLLDSSEEVKPVVVIADGAKIYQRPSKTSPSLGEAKFLDQYYLAAIVEESGRKYCLAAEMNMATQKPGKFIGWFAEEDILLNRQAIKDKPGIYLKGLIINQWNETIEKGMDISGAAALDGPGTRPGSKGNPYKKLAELGLFNFYFVYAKTVSKDTSETHFLLGFTPTIPNITKPAETLIGWVSGKRVYEWSTRQAVEFDKTTLKKRIGKKTKEQIDQGRGGVEIFETEEELTAYLRGQETLGDMELIPVAQEDIRVKEWQYNWPRFPLFDVKKNDVNPEAGPLYHVGYIGDQIYVKGGATGADVGTMANYQEELQKLQKDLRDIDLIFVIDSTGSMRNYFRSAAEGVKRITEYIAREYPVDSPERPDIRYSVVFYRDYADEDGQSDPNDTYLIKRLPLTGNTDAVRRFLEGEEEMICDGCGGDEPEAVFHAIDQSIATAAEEVKERTGYKAIILMGDKGNHAHDPRDYTVEKIADRIIKNGYDFFSFHVVNAEDVEKDVDVRRFREQTDRIQALIQMDALYNKQRIMTNDPEKIAQMIVETSRRLTEEMAKAKLAIRDISTGEAGLQDIKQQHGVQLTKRLTEMMEKRGIDPKVFVEKSIQIFGHGWTSEKDPSNNESQLRVMLLIDRPTLEQLLAILAGFIKEPPSRESVINVWTKVLKDVTTGDVDVNKPVAELIQNYLGIPIRKKLLHKSIEDIQKLNPEELAGLWQELETDLNRIRGIYTEQALAIEKGKDGKIEIKQLGSRKIWWQGQGKEYGWIPVEELP